MQGGATLEKEETYEALGWEVGPELCAHHAGVAVWTSDLAPDDPDLGAAY